MPSPAPEPLRQPIAGSPCSAEEKPLDRHSDPALWKQWNDLSKTATPFVRSEFFALEEPLVDDGVHLIVSAYRDHNLVGVLPLVRRGRLLESFASNHAPFYDYVGDADAVEQIWHTLRADRGWDRIILDRLPTRSVLLSRLPSLAIADLCVSIVKPGPSSPYFVLPNHEAKLNAKHKHNIRRCEKKIGGVELERITTFSREALEEGLAIEGAAWKDAAGSSIASSATLKHFYYALARLSARRGELSLYFLRAKGRRIAFLFALEDGHTLFALKTGYDPELREYSPGHLLFAEVARDAERRGLIELDFMGIADEWKRRWTDLTHDHSALLIYRPSIRGTSMLLGREVLKPRLPKNVVTRLASMRTELERRQRHCQRNDLVGAHSTVELLKGKVKYGVGIRSGFKRVMSDAPPKAKLGTPSCFAPGDWVRVKDADQIKSTLDDKNKLRGLEFVPAQWSSCGNVYRVSKLMRRLVDDEGELRAVSHTVLLENVTCDGHVKPHVEGEPAAPQEKNLGCGRHCPLMFRDEWLEPADDASHLTFETATEGFAQVRSLAEIEATLDESRRRDGLTFMRGMEHFAGRRLPIVRRLTRIYELGRWLEPRAPIYLLEGAYCPGAAIGKEGPCDRACTLLWHGDWLTIEPKA